MNILVTGIGGFIGYHLAKNLINNNYKVIGIDNLNPYYDVNLKKNRLKELKIYLKNDISKYSNDNLIFYKVDISNNTEIQKIFFENKIDAICHLAAQAGVRYSIKKPEAYIESNILGFQNVIEACRKYKIKNFSYASSSSVYGGNQNLPFSEKDRVDTPISLYAATKKSNELVAYTYSHLYGIQTTGLRFFTVYGPWGRPDMALFLFVKALLNNKPIDVYNNGKMLRDFTFIDDIVGGIIKVIQNPAKIPLEKSEFNPTKAPYKIYNIGNNSPTKLMDFISAIEQILNKKFDINYMAIQPGDVPKTFANIDTLVNDFNYRPSTPIIEGVEKFIKWYLKYYKIK